LFRPRINGISRIFLHRFLSRFLLFFFPVFLLSCIGTSKVLGISRDEAAVLLKKGDTGFICQTQLPDNFSEAESRLKQLSVIHSAVPFYAGLLIGGEREQNAGSHSGSASTVSASNNLEKLLFCTALESPLLPARREAALKLIPLILESENEKEVREIQTFLDLPKFKESAEIPALLAACLYRLGRYDEAAKIDLTQPASAKLAEWSRAFYLFASIYVLSGRAFSGASSTDGFREKKIEITAFLFGNLSDDVRRWANKEAFSSAGLLMDEELAILSTRPMQGNYGVALLKLRPALSDGGSIFFRCPDLLADLGRAYQYTPSLREEGAKLFKNWAALLDGQNSNDDYKELGIFLGTLDGEAIKGRKYLVNFYAGRIERAKTQYAESTEYFKRALEFAPDELQSDACHWYILMNALAGSTAAAMRQALATMGQWNDVNYFSDVLDSLSCYFVGKRQWGSVLELFYGLEKVGASKPLAQYAWILGRAVQEGYVKTERIAEDFFRIAFEKGKDSIYYRAMAASALGVSFTFDEGKSSTETQEDSEPGSELEFLLGFFEFGASSFALPYIQAVENDLFPPELRKVAEALAASGRWKDTLDFVSRYTSRKDFELTRQDLFLFHPQPFKELIEKYASEAELGAETLYGLIRTESYFVSDAVSRSGAVGLVQLMAPTAEDMAGRIARSGGPDYRNPAMNLKDPETSIHIGSYYLRYLIGQMGNPMLALLAYNGGMGRVRRWMAADRQQAGGALPYDLFLESIEISETRDYGRQVLSAASVYGYLYYGTSMEKVAADIYR
jgi:soluble lytic murein transglycosylase